MNRLSRPESAFLSNQNNLYSQYFNAIIIPLNAAVFISQLYKFATKYQVKKRKKTGISVVRKAGHLSTRSVENESKFIRDFSLYGSGEGLAVPFEIHSRRFKDPYFTGEDPRKIMDRRISQPWALAGKL